MEEREIIDAIQAGKKNFSGLDLKGIGLSGLILEDLDFSNSNLEEAFFFGSCILRTSFRDANLVKSDLRKVNLEIPFKAFAPDDILRSTSASGEKILVDFRGANLSGANLTAANFAFSNFENANLEGANLYHTCLCGANLIGANFINSNLTGVDFDDARMDTDIFRKARNANNMAMELHNMAMEYVEKALLAKRAGDIDEYQKLIRLAYEFDR